MEQAKTIEDETFGSVEYLYLTFPDSSVPTETRSREAMVCPYCEKAVPWKDKRPGSMVRCPACELTFYLRIIPAHEFRCESLRHLHTNFKEGRKGA